MEEKQKILLWNHEGKSKSEIALLLGLDVKTVQSYIKENEISLLKKEKSEDISNFCKKPKYDIRNRKKRKLTKEIQDAIVLHLLENEKKRKSGRSKQQKKVTDIYQCLIDDGFDIGSSTVYNYIREYKDKHKEAFIKQNYNPGDICEFDWGEVKLSIGGEKYQKYNLAVFNSAYSNFRYAYVVKKQDTQAFQYVHAKFFDYISGSYKTMVYDNMKVAVIFINHKEKKATMGLSSMAYHYGFKFRFANVRKGNEKGHVERSVEVVRRASFAYKDKFETIKEANDYLLEKIKYLNNQKKKNKNNLSAVDLLKDERKYLNDKKPFFETSFETESVVDKYSTISFHTNKYSVPEEYVGKILDLKIYSNKIIFYYKDKLIGEQVRFFTLGKWYINLDHYLKTLNKKPGALKGSVALKQADENTRSLYLEYYKGSEKDFINLLNYMKSEKKTLLEITDTIFELLKQSINAEITTDKIKMQINSLIEHNLEDLEDLNNNETIEQSKKQLSKYDDFMLGGNNVH